MEVLQKIISKQGTNLTTLDLEFKQIEQLDEILPLLANFCNLKELILHGNRLNYLPEDLSLLDSIEILDITNNMFQDLQQVVEALQTLPNLQHLSIGLKSKEEEQFVIDSLPNLQSLNSQQIKQEEIEIPQDQQLEEEQSERSLNGQEITMSQEDLETMAILYDHIRDLRKEDEETDKQISNLFDKTVAQVMKELTTNANSTNSEHLLNLNILKTKFNLYELCFKQLIRYFKLTDKKLESIVSRIHDAHFQIFTDMGSVIQNFKDNSNNNRQQNQQQFQKQGEFNQQKQDGDKSVEMRLRQELMELQQYNKELEQENKKYIDMLIRHTKGERIVLGDSNIKQDSNQPNSQEKKYLSQQQSLTYQMSYKQSQLQSNVIVAPPQAVRNLTLKQLKDVINEIYESKSKYDLKCQESKLPRETMEQHMYTFLNQKYGLKNLIIEWATSIINALKRFAAEDNDVAVFGKILRNECDEEFRFVQTQVKNTMQELLKMYLRGKYPLKHQAEVKEMLHQRTMGQLFEEEAVDIIKYMYNQEDAEVLLNKLKQYYIVPQKQIDRRLTREEQLQLMQEKDKLKLDYGVFQKIILDFQLKSHEKYLKKFIFSFKQMDTDANGIIDENEFRQLIGMLNFDASNFDVQRYLNIVDPYSHQQITFSQCVTLFSSETAPGSNGQYSILQKISEK